MPWEAPPESAYSASSRNAVAARPSILTLRTQPLLRLMSSSNPSRSCEARTAGQENSGCPTKNLFSYSPCLSSARPDRCKDPLGLWTPESNTWLPYDQLKGECYARNAIRPAPGTAPPSCRGGRRTQQIPPHLLYSSCRV